MGKRTIIFFMALCLAISWASDSEGQVISGTPTPSSFTLVRDLPSTQNITYLFTSSPPLVGTLVLSSGSGSFTAGGQVIGVNSRPLTATVAGVSGTVSESLPVPIRVLQNALRTNTNRFSYVRTFNGTLPSGAAVTVTTTVNFTITTEAGGAFGIRRIAIYFQNRRAEITVERNQPLTAYVDLLVRGSGLLQGFWEVDGRILSQVNQQLTFGAAVTLSAPAIPPLPTFETGSHTLRFVITNPVLDIPLPSALYYVLPEEFRGKPVALRLVAPGRDASLHFGPVTFEWQKITSMALFLIQFYDSPDSKPLFSAFTKENSYTLPEPVLNNIFTSGKTYYWAVKGFDRENNVIAESTQEGFRFSGKP
jgi:hypothetical protein